MTRSNSTFVLRRASERVSSGVAALALTCLTLICMDTRAADVTPDTPTVTVKYAETAFSTQAGAADVYRRLKFAARNVCSVNNAGMLALDRRIAAQKCADKALGEAVNRIDRPMLSSVHASSAHSVG